MPLVSKFEIMSSDKEIKLRKMNVTVKSKKEGANRLLRQLSEDGFGIRQDRV